MSAIKRINSWLGLSVLGLGVSVYLSNHYYELRGGSASFNSICKMGSLMDCDAIAATRWAEVIPSLPISNIAAGFYLGMLVLALYARSEQWRSAAIRTSFYLSLAGSVISLFYLVIMLGMLKKLCLFCLVQDAVIFISTGILWSIRSTLAPPHEKDAAQPIALLRAMSISVVAMTAVLWILMNPKKLEVDPAMMADSVLSGPVSAIQGIDTPDTLIIGDKSAPITIVEFSDFQCPHCQHGAKILNTIFHRYQGKVRIILRPFPLDPTCNRSIQGAGHSSACQAASIAYCAQAQGKLRHIYEMLFEHQEEMQTTAPREIAIREGLDAAALDACLASPAVKARVGADIEEGIRLGVQATPTYFINGYKVEGGYPVPAWERMIDRLLKSP